MSTAVMASRRPVESAYDRHVRMLQEARVYYRRVTGAPSAGETDADVLRAAHRFVRDERADAVAVAAGDWRTAMAAKYYEKLFKEYALADVSRYKEGMIGMRWRTEAEVVAGKGQFSCGCLGCEARDALESYELNFTFVEAGGRRAALVKVRACAPCALKLFHGREGKRKRARPQGQTDNRAGGGERAARRHRGGEPTTAVAEPAGARGAGEAVAPSAPGAAAAGEAAGVTAAAAAAAAASASAAWSKAPETTRTREDDIEDYFQGMFP